MNHLLILNDPPYGTGRSFNGLRMAHALAKNDVQAEITVWTCTGSPSASSAWQAA